VRDALAHAQADLVPGEENALTSQLRDGGLETDARAQRRLLEDQAHDAARQGFGELALLMVGLELGRALEQMRDFLEGQVQEVEKVLHGSSSFVTPTKPRR